MSHKLSIVRGIAEMFSGRGIKPWHGLGQIVKGLLTSREAIKAAHLDWQVEARPLYFESEQLTRADKHLPKWLPINRRALVRDDTEDLLAVVSDDYEIFQNTEAFRFMDALIADGQAKYDTAGALHGGKWVWLLIKLNPEDFKKRPNDKVDHYCLLSNNFGQHEVITIRQCLMRVVCWNTWTAALNERQAVFRIPHRGNIQSQVDTAREALGLVTKEMRALEKVLDEIRGIKMNEREVEGFSYKVSPEREPEQEAIRYLFKNGIGCEGKNRYDAWNAVTQLTTHHLGARGSDEKKAESRLKSVVRGRGHAMQKRALAALLLS